VRLKKVLLLQVATCALACAPLAPQATQRAQFHEYSVEKVYTGTPAAPKLTKAHRVFRTRIREGAKEPPNFAGHYRIVTWGCGTWCVEFLIVDSVSGKVQDGFAVGGFPGRWQEEHQKIPERIEFKRDSRLLRVNGCPNEANCGFYDYLMDGTTGLQLLHVRLLGPKYR
jgi:hypothetical protein